ncbi:MAG: glycosyltransferase family 4 protein [Candidatus Fermentibacteraceae bacterium]|nr:glycosyltransferase family 4 protein [Candidatus Fermentibacteraceae bacterium]
MKTLHRDSRRISFVMLGLKDYSTGGYYFNFKMVEALRQAGHEVDVVHFTTIPERIRGSRIRTSLHVLKRVLKYRPDLIVISKSYSFMVPIRLLLSVRKYPVLYLVHHLEWHDRSGDVSRARRSIVRWFLSCGRKIWVNSLSTANDVVSLGIREEKLCIIPPGFERFELAPGSRIQQPVRILSVGAICPRKDQLTLVKACAGLGNTDFHLLILGDETVDAGYAEAVRREADRDSLRGKVTFMGHISQDDLHRMYNQCHILANLSQWEGYGIAVAEAMWAGLPVVAADAGAVPELITHGVNGFLIPPGNEEECEKYLRELIVNIILREKMSASAHMRAEELFTWVDTGRMFVNLAEETAGREIRMELSV